MECSFFERKMSVSNKRMKKFAVVRTHDRRFFSRQRMSVMCMSWHLFFFFNILHIHIDMCTNKSDQTKFYLHFFHTSDSWNLLTFTYVFWNNFHEKSSIRPEIRSNLKTNTSRKFSDKFSFKKNTVCGA